MNLTAAKAGKCGHRAAFEGLFLLVPDYREYSSPGKAGGMQEGGGGEISHIKGTAVLVLPFRVNNMVLVSLRVFNHKKSIAGTFMVF